MKTARIHYFSATGNTQRAVKIIQSKLENNNYKVSVINITKESKVEHNNFDLEIFAFPVLAFAAPAFVRKYFKRLPYANNRNAAVMACNGGDPLQANHDAEKILQKKGYSIICSSSIVYPSNWTQIISSPTLEKANTTLIKGDLAAEQFIQNMLGGNKFFYRTKGFTTTVSRIVSILFRIFGRRFLGKLFIADDTCNSCSLCAKSCPSNTITMVGKNKKIPYWRFNCENCNRCINICPQHSIQTSIGRFICHGILHVALITFAVLSVFKINTILSKFGGLVLIGTVDIVGIILLIIGLTKIQFIFFDFIIYKLQQIPLFEKFFQWTFTKNYNRYKAPGFIPSVNEK